MKKLCLFLLLTSVAVNSIGKTLLHNNYNTSTDTISLNVAENGIFGQSRVLHLMPNKAGIFKYSLTGNTAKFVAIHHNNDKLTLLLLPGKQLSVNTDLKLTKGNGYENELMLTSAVNDSSFAINKMNSKERWSADSLINVMLPMVDSELRSTLEKTGVASVPDNVKELIALELKYYYASELMKFTAKITNKLNRQATWKKLEDKIVEQTSLPTAYQLLVSPAANSYLQYYMVYRLKEMSVLIRETPANSKAIVEKQTGLPIDTAMMLTKNYGEDYLGILLARKYLPADVQEKLLLNMIEKYSDNKDLIVAKKFLQNLAVQYPKSKYLPEANKEVGDLEKVLATNEKNKSIVFLAHDDKLISLKDLIAPYKGKVVYIDIWGTWCEPCVNELVNHTAALKEHFKNKNIVFLYIEMDYDANDVKWKNFVNIHNLTGYHIRLSNLQMENIWVDLLHTKDVVRLYPGYAIIDTDGNVLNSKARKPSEGQPLYNDLDLAINK